MRAFFVVLALFSPLVMASNPGHPYFSAPQISKFSIYEYANCTGEVLYKTTTKVGNCTKLSDMGCYEGYLYTCVMDFDDPLSMENHITWRYSRYQDQCVVEDQTNGHVIEVIGFKTGCFSMGTQSGSASMRFRCEPGLQKVEYYRSSDCSGMVIFDRTYAFETDFDVCKPAESGKWHVVHCGGESK